MKELLKKFEDRKPEIAFEWNDKETEAKGWVVINSLRNGAAGGGTRMRPGLDRNEVESLAKTMEIKFTVSGPPIGGAKSGIDFDPKDPRKKGVLERWYKAVTPLLKSYYGTGGDLNVDEIYEVIPITEDLGLWHPQEGIVNGYYKPDDPQKIKKIGQLRLGVKKVIEDLNYTLTSQKKYTVADMVTGYGVAEAVKHYYELWGGSVATKSAIVQGWGNVGGAAACYLAKEGVRIKGIIDKDGGLLSEDGFNLDEVKHLFSTREGNKLKHENLESFEETNSKIWSTGAEIFIPAAASRLVDKAHLDQMKKAGLEVISCGANVPFRDREIFFGPTMEHADENLALIPDFIANCGMARVFAYLMQHDAGLTDEEIFKDISSTIKKALSKIREQNNSGKNISSEAFELAIKQLI